MNSNIPSSIYLHIPFCSHICSYCDFCKVFYDEKYIDSYLINLENEIKNRYKDEKINTLYIGGGTPSSLNIKELTKLLKMTKLFKLNKDCEFTFEANVENINYEKALLLYKHKVNRISLGVQSFDYDNLAILQRKHTKEDVFKVISMLKNIGFKNISIDLIYGIDYNLNKVKEDIKNYLKLDISHVSCYSLIIEDNTILKINNYPNIDEDLDYKMYQYIESTLTRYNYIHYEISNYAKEGYQSKHNLTYWNNNYYYGFGLGSVSYLNNYRISNTRNLSKYLKGIYLEEKVYENKNIRIENEIMLNLRKIEGINLDKFYQKYQIKLLDLYNINDLLINQKLLIENNFLKINPKYLYIENEIIIKILEGEY